jgi:hypothetical protein
MPIRPTPNQHPNRKIWLNNVGAWLRPAFVHLGAGLPDWLRIAIAFPSIRPDVRLVQSRLSQGCYRTEST